MLPSGRPPAAGEAGGRIKDLPALLVHEFLDITSVMPPECLRWSRVLKRPVMHLADQGDRCVGTIYIEEVLPYREAQVGGQCVHYGESIIFVARSVADLPSRLHCRDFFWGAHLYSDLGRPFTEAWEVMGTSGRASLTTRYIRHWCGCSTATWTSSSRGAGMPAIKRWASTPDFVCLKMIL